MNKLNPEGGLSRISIFGLYLEDFTRLCHLPEATGNFDIFQSQRCIGRLLFSSETADDAGRRSHDEGALWDDFSLGDESAGGDGAASSNDGAVQDDGPHADEDLIPDGAGMNHCAVADRHPCAEDTGVSIADVKDAAVLDVALWPHDDAVDVPAQHAGVPDAGLWAQIHSTDDDGTGGNKSGVSHGWFYTGHQEIFQGL
jgi:hypothetical protein